MVQTPNAGTDELDTAYALFEAGRYQEALEKYLALANRGSISAQLHLGWAYQEGTGVPKDLAEARRWYQKAADSTSPVGQYYLALLLTLEKNYEQAMAWLKKAAAQNYMPAIYRLGKMYETGKGVAVDERKAYEYYEQAAQQGHLFAQRAIAGKMIKGHYGIAKIPKGLCQFVRVLWTGAKVAAEDEHDERIRT